MNKLFLTMLFSVATIVASAQITVMTTVTEVEDEYNFTDNLAVGYNVSDILMLGLEMDGEDNYEVIARYAFADKSGWSVASFTFVISTSCKDLTNLLNSDFLISSNGACVYVPPSYGNTDKPL